MTGETGKLGRLLARWAGGGSENKSPESPRRFLTGKSSGADAYLKAAHAYTGQMSGFELEWLYRKPYDPRPGHEQFFLQIYAVMNLLKVMDVPAGGRILEVGSGPG
jgi:hypothetical protein